MAEAIGDIIEQQQYIAFKIFNAVNYERTMMFKGALLRVSKPGTAKNPQLPDKRDIKTEEPFQIPKNHEVEVIDGWVTLTRSSAS
ncbi:hypothetical protein BDBG_17754 [Blastomyces gilchristii SLH14081]|uniref:Uncharacterized protein n=1 Tax=Blastomyces gilchristii (strain SLH14081) TaxID=559298 RepID=A0A179UZF4_BLAGS|nr:uncharacterized protein BDBG_17754 [Blastomyces gilchristii SLH14081]OAT13230.1 hypothetical protein BDBG_17754 [Blastomyces gilchristii SLH14081]